MNKEPLFVMTRAATTSRVVSTARKYKSSAVWLLPRFPFVVRSTQPFALRLVVIWRISQIALGYVEFVRVDEKMRKSQGRQHNGHTTARATGERQLASMHQEICHVYVYTEILPKILS